MLSNAESWVLRPDMAKGTPRVPADTEYHRAFAGEERRIVRGLVAIILLFAGLIGFAQLCLAVASTIDTQLLGRTGFTPLQHAAGAFALALLIPYSMLLQRWLMAFPGAHCIRSPGASGSGSSAALSWRSALFS